MKIETMDDWNQVLSGCCCTMPVCPNPILIGERKGFAAYVLCAHYLRNSNGEWGAFRKFTYRYTKIHSGHGDSTGGTYVYEEVREFSMDGLECDWPKTTTTTGSTGYCGYDAGINWNHVESTAGSIPGTEYSETKTRTLILNSIVWPNHFYQTIREDIYSEGVANVNEALFSEASGLFPLIPWQSGGGEALTQYGGAFAQAQPTVVPGIRLYAARYRWKIPDSFAGAYFKITWDILEEPDGWEDEPPTAERTFYAENLTWVWAGPGDPDDPDSWMSGWYEIPPTKYASTRRVVNIRFECLRSSRFGTKPQVIGEAVEL